MDRRSEQLGMPFGTAYHQLRKLVLFSLLVRHNENICYKCSKVIGNAKELSIEHKKPWLHISTELFWDTNNVAFSHLVCNTPDRRGGYKLRKVGADGMSWCSGCQSFKPNAEFYKHKGHWNGLGNYCKNCRKNRSR